MWYEVCHRIHFTGTSHWNSKSGNIAASLRDITHPTQCTIQTICVILPTFTLFEALYSMDMVVFILWQLCHFLLRYSKFNIWPWKFKGHNQNQPKSKRELKIIVVKVQFRGPELYKKKRTLFQEESYLPRIFRSSSLDLHIFHLIHIVFWWQIFFHKHMASWPPTIGKTAMFWSSMLWSWRHNAAGARELSANHTLQSMTTTCR